MTTADLRTVLDPRRFSNMSGQMAAIMGYLLEQPYTTPALAEVLETPDGAVLGRAEGDASARVFIGAEAELSEAQWQELGELVQRKLGIGLDGRV